jgi:glyoxylase-like metal-dependent hydrolase (beta-lactamase superfamily II)
VPAFICRACGTEFPPSRQPPDHCPICDDERQFVPPAGQSWTTLDGLAAAHANSFRQHLPDTLSISTVPSFAIGQRAFLLLSPRGNVLWDCVSLIDNATATLIRALGGVAAIAISHPHFYTTMNRWSELFGARVFLHADDRRWVMQPGDNLVFWDGGRHEIQPGMTLLRCGGHFAGGTVLHRASDDGGGVLFSGDTLQVTPDRRNVSFMRSYPNLIPLSAAVVHRIVQRLDGFPFDRIYGAFPEREIEHDGAAAVQRSAERYIRGISGSGPADAEP